jgi:tight adherence protein C
MKLQESKQIREASSMGLHAEYSRHVLEGLRKTKACLKIFIMHDLVVILKKPVIRVFAAPLLSRMEERKTRALRESCTNDLPEMVDILALGLGAGLSIDKAIEWYFESYENPLSKELGKAENLYQVGMMSRIQAFEAFAQDLGEESVLRFVSSLRIALAMGTPLAPSLDTLSQDLRNYRAAWLEERIAKTPVKMLIPLGLCIVPAVLILLMGPILAQVVSGLAI